MKALNQSIINSAIEYSTQGIVDTSYKPSDYVLPLIISVAVVALLLICITSQMVYEGIKKKSFKGAFSGLYSTPSEKDEQDKLKPTYNHCNKQRRPASKISQDAIHSDECIPITSSALQTESYV